MVLMPHQSPRRMLGMIMISIGFLPYCPGNTEYRMHLLDISRVGFWTSEEGIDGGMNQRIEAPGRLHFALGCNCMQLYLIVSFRTPFSESGRSNDVPTPFSIAWSINDGSRGDIIPFVLLPLSASCNNTPVIDLIVLHDVLFVVVT